MPNLQSSPPMLTLGSIILESFLDGGLLDSSPFEVDTDPQTMPKKNLSGQDIASLLKAKKIQTKNVTSTSLIALVDGDRGKKMLEIASMLKALGAVVDKNLPGSSIGGIKIGPVKILIKQAGKTGGLDVESGAIQALQTAVAAAVSAEGGPIAVKVGSTTFKGVVKVVKTPGTPKSDFHLADTLGKPLVHISHKKGSKATDFQQWGGVTEPRIANHPEVIRFGERCRALFGDTIGSGQSAYAEIQDPNLKKMSVYGVAFDSGSTNPDRVDVLIQGDPGLKKVGSSYQLTATGHLMVRDDLPSGPFEPVLAMIYKGDRTQFGVKGSRVSIYPRGGRPFKTKIP